MTSSLLSSKTVATQRADSLLEELLAEQQTLSAVARFSEWHESAEPDQAKYYRDLLPLTRPQPGEQYAFEVDLAACSGCKACVTACHSMNGLEEEETWREVGLLLHPAAELPLVQHVTTACHHCVEPGCLQGCPVQAYDKDPATGIVRHLDDQCIGCQYCILMCPYEVPKYSAAKGIVRKCDMCRQRLAADEAPACVQACPNQAIRITVVKQADAKSAAAEGDFLPASPSPRLTIPTTRFRGARSLPADAVAADAELLRPAHAHPALTVMLVLTQLSVGLLAVERGLQFSTAGTKLADALLIAALVTGLIGGNTALLHLGRPFGAWRAWLGWQTSWLSREIVLFGAYSGLLAVAAGLLISPFFGTSMAAAAEFASPLAHVIRGMALLCGFAGVSASAMIYVATGRAFWSGPRTFGKFFLTLLILGVTATLVIEAAAQCLAPTADWSLGNVRGFMWGVSPFLTIIKMWVESRWFFCDPLRFHPAAIRSQRLMRGELRGLTRLRLGCGIVGGWLIPAAVFACGFFVGEIAPPLLLAFAVAALLVRLAGELVERHLFFIACIPTKMPGGLSP